MGVEFELNLPGLNELMKSDGMKAALLEAGNSVARSAGEGFEAEVHTANFVAISNVFPATKEAGRKNYKENTLLKAIGQTGLKMR